MFGVQAEEVGGHRVGTQLVPMFTTRDRTLQGINLRVPPSLTTVTQTEPQSDLFTAVRYWRLRVYIPRSTLWTDLYVVDFVFVHL